MLELVDCNLTSEDGAFVGEWDLDTSFPENKCEDAHDQTAWGSKWAVLSLALNWNSGALYPQVTGRPPLIAPTVTPCIFTELLFSFQFASL